MAKIITTSELQKNIGKIDKLAKVIIVTKRGKGNTVMLPYFDDNEEAIEEYLEEYEMRQNKKALQKRYEDAAKSGLSDLKI